VKIKLRAFISYNPRSMPYITKYAWACPHCGCDQTQLAKPVAGDKVQCYDCDKEWEVEE
jgi:hypothetical protein